MDLHNRLKDVEKMECNAVQDFMKMLVNSGWQSKIYSVANEAIINKRRYKDKYIHAYETMRNIGIESFTVEQMDITLLSSIISYGEKFLPEISIATDQTRKEIDVLRIDKNSKSHSGHNEPQEDLYLQGIISLFHLKQFVISVDKNETYIDDKKRLDFRQKYFSKINKLIDELDTDRYEIIFEQKTIEKDVKQVLHSANKSKSWNDMHELYMERYYHFKKYNSEYDNERNKRLLQKFEILSSESGIADAHKFAIRVLLSQDSQKAIQHIKTLKPFSLNLANSVLGDIQLILLSRPEKRGEMLSVIDAITEQGYIVEEKANNQFILKPIE